MEFELIGIRNANAIVNIPSIVVVFIPILDTKYAPTKFMVTAPKGILNNISPKSASFSRNFSFTKGINVAQVPNKNPLEKNAAPMALLCLWLRKS